MITKKMIVTIAVSAAAIGALIAGTAIAQGAGSHGMAKGGDRPSFETLDADGDGNLTIAESRAHFDAEFAEKDSDGDGSLSAEEMTEAATRRAAEHATTRISRLIEWRDSDGDGKLSQTELGGNMIEKMFSHLDADDDGVITEDEFARMDMGDQRGGHRGKWGKGKSGHGGHMDQKYDGHGMKNDG